MTIIEDRHYYASCDQCRWLGELRFTEEIAERDANRHLRDAHGLDPATLYSRPTVIDDEGNAHPGRPNR